MNVSLKFGHTHTIPGLACAWTPTSLILLSLFFAIASVAMRAAPRSFHWVGRASPPLSFPSGTRTRKEWKSPGLTLVYKWIAYIVQNTITQISQLTFPILMYEQSSEIIVIIVPIIEVQNWGSVKTKALLNIRVQLNA